MTGKPLHQRSSRGAPRRLRTIWISDVHLGFRGTNAERLLDFLAAHESEYLYLVGDIVDLWQLRRRAHWPQSHNDVLRAVLAKAAEGTRVIYVPGNHDQSVRAYIGFAFGNISIVAQALHTRANGERLLVLHGDEFDAVVASSRWLGWLGGLAYEALLEINLVVDCLRRWCGFPRWSLARTIKLRVGEAVRYIERFEQAVAAHAARAAVEGVVCGHIHRPEVATIAGIAYHNCGDWVESCTALVELQDGRVELVDWSPDATCVVPLGAAA
jgi:UDP-2,3-diacylglucosamine pyrophosphatase LpxH